MVGVMRNDCEVSLMKKSPMHAGEHLSEELRALGMSAAALARNLGVPTNRITQILNGQREITGDTALRLAHFFGTTAEFWLNLQNLYELRIAQQKTGKIIKSLPTLKHSELSDAHEPNIDRDMCHPSVSAPTRID